MISANSANGSCILSAKSGSPVTVLRRHVEELSRACQTYGLVRMEGVRELVSLEIHDHNPWLGDSPL